MTARTRFTRKVGAFVGAASLIIVVLTAAIPAASAAKQATKGGGLVFLSPAPADSASLDAAKIAPSGLVASQQILPIYDTLIDYRADGTVVPRIATAVTGTAPYSEWTIKLRPGVQFTDSTPLDAAAVVAHWTRLKDPAVASPARADALQITSATPLDATTVRVNLAAPDAQFPLKLTGILGMIPSPTAVAKYGAAYGTTPETIVGAGPFIVKEWVRGDHTSYSRNPRYWDARRPYLDAYTYKIITDTTTRYNTFVSRGGDVNAATAPGDPLVKMRANYKQIAWNAPNDFVVAMNTRAGRPTADVRLRNILVNAVDVDAIVQRAALGATAAHTLFPPTSPYYVAIKQPDNKLALAQTAMKEYLQATGKSSVSVSIATNAQFQPVVEAMKQDWDKVSGLNVTIEPVLTVGPRTVSRDFDMIISGLGGAEPSVLVNSLLSSAASTNVTGINSPQLDSELIKSQATADPSLRKQSFKTVQEVLVRETPYIYVHRIVMSYFPSKSVTGLKILAGGGFDVAAVSKAS